MVVKSRKSLHGKAACLLDLNDDEQERVSRASPSVQAKQVVSYDFSSVLNMCTANKVNVTNTWSLDLIDHIDDILEAQQGSFQKASCTLQASVQIYEKRVDSTHQATFKMLENVNRTRNGAVGDAEENRAVRRKANTCVSTYLESNLNTITNDAIEKEYDVDPLFKKMAKTFDAGGAKGLLVNNLYVHDGPVIIFDTSETLAFHSPAVEPRTVFAPLVLKTNKFTPESTLDPLCPSLELLHRILSTSTHNQNDDEPSSDEHDTETVQFSPAPEYAEDGFIFEDDQNDCFSSGGYESDKSHDEKITSSKHGGIDFSYFDAYGFFKETTKNKAADWAGPSHWKFGRPKVTSVKSTAKKTVAKKVTFLTFTEIADPIKNVAKLSTINLSKKTTAQGNNELPEDMHYTIQDLCKLFLKPVVISEVVGNNNQSDDDAAGFFDSYEDGPEGLSNHLGSLVQPSHMVEKISVDYARKAKKVDVQKLKEAIWEEIEPEEEEASPRNLSFCDSIHKISAKVASEEVTVPYYFICLLHLANENNLEFEGRDDLTDFMIQ